jgi:hypothetical protein
MVFGLAWGASCKRTGEEGLDVSGLAVVGWLRSSGLNLRSSASRW